MKILKTIAVIALAFYGQSMIAMAMSSAQRSNMLTKIANGKATDKEIEYTLQRFQQANDSAGTQKVKASLRAQGRLDARGKLIRSHTSSSNPHETLMNDFPDVAQALREDLKVTMKATVDKYSAEVNAKIAALKKSVAMSKSSDREAMLQNIESFQEQITQAISGAESKILERIEQAIYEFRLNTYSSDATIQKRINDLRFLDPSATHKTFISALNNLENSDLVKNNKDQKQIKALFASMKAELDQQLQNNYAGLNAVNMELNEMIAQRKKGITPQRRIQTQRWSDADSDSGSDFGSEDVTIIDLSQQS